MNNDLAIAQSVTPRPITEVAAALGLTLNDLELYGTYKAKIGYSAIERHLNDPVGSEGKIVLMTAITPTTAGEGKTTVTVGLGQALCRLGKRAIVTIREPSMGPVFGLKGGAAGGGYAQVIPMEDINLHFTGDMHAISAAHNLLAAAIDNHLHHGNRLNIDPLTISFPRVVDMNDRALRHIVVGLGGKQGGIPRESQFFITVASEVMAILCLSNHLSELKDRLGKIVVGQNRAGEPITAADLKVHGAMTVLLRDALKPNLVQTLEGTPAFVHGGPFGNIAHGCSSIIATKLARRLGEIVVTEAGFGADLGFEKYCNIVAPTAGLPPDAVVIVATIRALKMHGGVRKQKLDEENLAALEAGLVNLERHVGIVQQVKVPFVIAINRFSSDSVKEIALVQDYAQSKNWLVAPCDVWGQGGKGGEELAAKVLQALEQPAHFTPFYTEESSLLTKMETIAKRVYGANGIALEPAASTQLRWLEKNGFGRLRVCMAKTQYSFSDDPKAGGAPTNFTLHIRELRLSAGAGFVVALAGDIMTMPGLPEVPAAENIDIDDTGRIVGLF
ncbi:Formate-tetrahydrofolate ligase [Chthonomonas calidirosea]|uniref:formate--tetrahydrofolate ligase n=1 Tax=Chthonomonas calidirosea TaxID=454171 RepID=UPI0006DD4868|nr:formate--tetrahydrofolate ligase [Chthonomonas calidirosea]CEK15211.1 Formate-tetrahydrofolate ligase [Chthonomonas calidirosea]